MGVALGAIDGTELGAGDSDGSGLGAWLGADDGSMLGSGDSVGVALGAIDGAVLGAGDSDGRGLGRDVALGSEVEEGAELACRPVNCSKAGSIVGMR